MSEFVLKSLLRRLEESEKVILGLVQMMLPLKKWQEHQRVLKLERIKEDLSDVPVIEENFDFLDDWRIIIIMLWSKFCQIGDDHRALANERKKRKDASKKKEEMLRKQSLQSFSGRSSSGGYGSRRKPASSKSSSFNRVNCNHNGDASSRMSNYSRRKGRNYSPKY